MKIFKRFRSKPKFKSIGKNVHIMSSSKFRASENIEIGNDVYIGPDNNFLGYGGIKIGNGTILAHNIEIMTRNHNYDSPNLQTIPYDTTYILKPVEINENVWIGSNVLIVPGVTIGEGAVVAMGAVVTKDVPPFAVVGGNPAKVLKYRDKEKYEELKSNNKIYLKEKFNS